MKPTRCLLVSSVLVAILTPSSSLGDHRPGDQLLRHVTSFQPVISKVGIAHLASSRHQTARSSWGEQDAHHAGHDVQCV